MSLLIPEYLNHLSGNTIPKYTALMQVPSYSQPLAAIDFGKMFQQHNNPRGWMLLGSLLVVLVLLRMSGSSKLCGISPIVALLDAIAPSQSDNDYR
jgi:hypothetical protein